MFIIIIIPFYIFYISFRIAHLELISAGPVGHVRIQGMLTKYYVAMDSKGRLYSEVSATI